MPRLALILSREDSSSLIVWMAWWLVEATDEGYPRNGPAYLWWSRLCFVERWDKYNEG